MTGPADLRVTLTDWFGKFSRAIGTAMNMKAYYANAAQIYSFFLANGFTPAQACGILAQADAESSLDPTAVGDKDTAFGMFQWHGARATVIKKGCGVDVAKLPPMTDQLTAALWELNHSEHSASIQIKLATTAYDAGYAAARFWERPGSPLQYAKRGDKAEAWATYFSQHPVA